MNDTMDMLAYCGLYCELCSFKVAHDENDVKHIANLPFPFELKDLSAYDCAGCKGDCICGGCKIKPCASEKGVESCADCGSFPCEHIGQFENDGMPHHNEAIENLRYIKRHGLENWLEKMKTSLRCEKCEARQSWYYACDEHNRP